MTPIDRARNFYVKCLLGNMRADWDADDADKVVAQLATILRTARTEAMNDATAAIRLREQSASVMTLGGERR